MALGDLKQLSVPLAKATLIANRQASNLNIGEVFKLTWPELGIAQLVMRVVRISYGTLTDGRVRIECVEDGDNALLLFERGDRDGHRIHGFDLHMRDAAALFHSLNGGLFIFQEIIGKF